MKKSKRILKVPKESFLRNKLRKETRRMAETMDLLPPLSFEQMEMLAAGLLKNLEISEDYTDFTIVLIGNESWRKTIEATPFNRRLLLLPQCLKDNASCKGVFDELGLNCAGCRACPIDDILLDAGKLGYTTLVAEGTTVAIGLVEEGAIDAVIGVSCMPVLQRSFAPVTNAAVPVIGLPLMYDGCENTKIDLKWLYDEISAFQPDTSFQPLSISSLKNEVENFFLNGELAKYFAERDRTEIQAMEFVQSGGQRMRPLIAWLSYQAYSGPADENILYPLLLIIECFHKASLIHDDIQDNADTRYNQAAAHKKYGIPQAINIGDYLIGKGYHVFSELPVNAERLSKGLWQISESHLKLTQGQGADILFNQGQHNLSVEEMLQSFKNKTGEAIKVALVLGAILGGAGEAEIEILKSFSDYFGIAYQIRDDLNEYRENSETGKIADFPFLSVLLNEKGEKNIVDIRDFRARIGEQGLLEKAEASLGQYVQNCYSQLDMLKNAQLRLSLYSVLGKIFKPFKVDA